MHRAEKERAFPSGVAGRMRVDCRFNNDRIGDLLGKPGEFPQFPAKLSHWALDYQSMDCLCLHQLLAEMRDILRSA